jgi:hypothetical protein
MGRAGYTLATGLGIAVAAVAAQPATAGNAVARYYFFSQPEVPREQVLADFEECRDLAGVVQPPNADLGVYAQGMAQQATLAILEGMQRGEMRRTMADAAWRRCLAIKGYRRYSMDKDEAKELYAGSWEAESGRMADRALAPVGDHSRIDP